MYTLYKVRNVGFYMGIGFFASLYITPPIPWSAPWLFYIMIPMWMVFCRLVWISFTLYFVGFVHGFGGMWQRVNGAKTVSVVEENEILVQPSTPSREAKISTPTSSVR